MVVGSNGRRHDLDACRQFDGRDDGDASDVDGRLRCRLGGDDGRDDVPGWRLKGVGFEFCNCQPGCTCNFSGFPTSQDGSCKAAVANSIEEGHCGDIDLSGIDAVAILDWPTAIHDGGGKAVFVVPEEVTEEQLGAMAQIFTGQLGGMPWEILGTTFEIAGVVRAPVNITHNGIDSGFSIPGVGEAKGTTLRNPVTGEPHGAAIVLDEGFI